MKAIAALPIVAAIALAGAALGHDLKDQVTVQVKTSEVHEGMAPGTFVCAEGHLHIRGSVQNMADEPVGQVKVQGKVFDAKGKLLGTATASTKQAVLNPKDAADVNLEFLTVTGSKIKQVKKQELTVVAVGTKS
jgi:hypothetical protein